MPSAKLASEFGLRLPVQILQSNAGWYLGSANEAGPVSRESLEYWPRKEQAQNALNEGLWTQRNEP